MSEPRPHLPTSPAGDASALAAWLTMRESSGSAGSALRACRLVLERSIAIPSAAETELVAALDLLGGLGVGEEAQAACVLHMLATNGVTVGEADFATFPADVHALFDGQQAA